MTTNARTNIYHCPFKSSQEGSPKLKRIVIIGCPGSGKSVLARGLGAALDVEVVHLDAIFHRLGWVPTPRDQWIAIQQELVKKETWIIDGHYRSTLDIRLEAADTVLLLDIPRTVCLWRAVKRFLLGRNQPRPDLAPGCPEKFEWTFLKWIWPFPKTERPALLEKLDQYRDGRVIIQLRTPAEVMRFLRNVGHRKPLAT